MKINTIKDTVVYCKVNYYCIDKNVCKLRQRKTRLKRKIFERRYCEIDCTYFKLGEEKS